MIARLLPLADAATSAGVAIEALRLWILDGRLASYLLQDGVLRVKTQDIDSLKGLSDPSVSARTGHHAPRSHLASF